MAVNDVRTARAGASVGGAEAMEGAYRKRVRVAGGDELVEDDGFTFKRKKKTGAAAASANVGGMGNGGGTLRERGNVGVGGASGGAARSVKPSAPPNPSAELLYPTTARREDMTNLHKTILSTWPEGRRLRELCVEMSAKEAPAIRIAYKGSYEYIGFAAAEALEAFVANVETEIKQGNFNFVQSSKAASRLETRKLRLKQLKESYENEEREWKELLEQSMVFDSTRIAEVSETELASAEQRGRDDVGKDSVLNAMPSACAASTEKLGLQVEQLCAMVSGVRRLCSDADGKSRFITTEFMKESYKSYPHVDDPKHLLANLSKMK